MATIPAGSRTVLLDSCFSGGMLWSAREIGHANWTPRYYRRSEDADSSVNSPVNSQDDNHGVVAGDAACYFTASRGNQVSYEMEFGGQPHGVFSFFLLRQLRNAGKRWGDVQTVVSAGVADATGGLQVPTLSPRFADSPALAQTTLALPAPVASQTAPSLIAPQSALSSAIPSAENSLWLTFNRDNSDATRVTAMMQPNKTTLVVGEELWFQVHLKQEGYLVVLEHGTSGQVNLLYPHSGRLSDASISAGATVRLPEHAGDIYTPNAAGHQRIKAILFTSSEDAANLLAAFAQSASVAQAHSKDLVIKPGKASRFYTSELQFEVITSSRPAH